MRGWIRRIPERLFHAGRRRTAIRSLQALASGMGPGPVVFICYGNICRSPFAAAVFREQIVAASGGTFVRPVRSAGFIGPDRAPPPEALDAAKKYDIDMSTHRSQLITPELVRSASLIVVMSADQLQEIRNRYGPGRAVGLVLGDLDPEPIRTRTIKDPWGNPPEVFDASYARIDRCVSVLVSVLTFGREV